MVSGVYVDTQTQTRTLTLTEELFTGEQPQITTFDKFRMFLFNFLNLYFALFNHSEWIRIYVKETDV